VASIDAVRVLHSDDEVARHVRSYDAGRYVEDPEHLRDRTFEDAATAARTELRQGLHEAARKLVVLTKDPDPNVALRAVGMLMDRAGLPRSEVVITNAPPLDLSELTVEELDLTVGARTRWRRPGGCAPLARGISETSRRGDGASPSTLTGVPSPRVTASRRRASRW